MCRLNRIFIALLACFVVRSALSEEAENGRVTRGLAVLYTFDEASGDVIHDRSDIGEPLDLKIETPQAVARRKGRLVIASSARIVSAGPAKRMIAAIKQSGELTLEAWLRPHDDRQGGPARIVSLSADPVRRNFTFGQEKDRYDARLRTTKTDANGIPSLSTPPGIVQADLSHVAYTRDRAGNARLYVNGAQQTEGKVEGDLSGWSEEFRLSLANELTGDRTWLGELRLVAVYARALTEEEVGRNFAAGLKPPTDYAALLPPPAKRRIDFVKDVRPIFREHCFECHAKGNEEGGLNLGIRSRVAEGGSGGAVIVRGSSAASRLVHAVSGLDADFVMPPDGERLSAEQVGVLRAWIDQGADWPPGADVLDPRAEQAKQHWAFQPLRAIEPPQVTDTSWPRNAIDRFILARLEAAGLRPAPPLAPRGLIRRAAFDVAGLPPTPEEIDGFRMAVDRDRSSAYDALVERLLAGRHYGERWARHWLDVAHYADSNGMENDADRPNAFHYRDFVIRALNDDLPFNTFVRWQLAGDEYHPDNAEAVAATGFLTCGPSVGANLPNMKDEQLRTRYNELDDMLSTIGTAMFGLTIGCARCHDHKYDAIPTRDYYRLMCALHGGNRAQVPLAPRAELAAYRRQHAEWKKELKAAEASGDKDQVKTVRGREPAAPPTALAFRDSGANPAATWLFRRANYYDHEQPVQLGFLSIFTSVKTAGDYWQAARAERPLAESSYQRKALAEWIADSEHGAGALVARVIVNRVWQHHFGEGLARTVSDFGAQGEPPTHPELLEWLAYDFVSNGWKLKRLHSLILKSAAYQQGVEFDAAKAALDPENRLLSRRRPLRLEAEMLRDSMLAVSGTLNLEPFGPAFKPPITGDAMVARNLKDPYPKKIKDGPATRRRSVYMFHKRVVPYPLLAAFDAPDAQQGCGRRPTTTVAPQALALLNDPFVRGCAVDLADRLRREAGDSNANCVARAYQLALGRAPVESEAEASSKFIDAQTERRRAREPQTPPDETRRQALADFCQALFGLNEFIYVD